MQWDSLLKEPSSTPTASSVIPFLDTVFDDLETLLHEVEGEEVFCYNANASHQSEITMEVL